MMHLKIDFLNNFSLSINPFKTHCFYTVDSFNSADVYLFPFKNSKPIIVMVLYHRKLA